MNEIEIGFGCAIEKMVGNKHSNFYLINHEEKRKINLGRIKNGTVKGRSEELHDGEDHEHC